MFDAGSIEATLRVATAQASADLAKIEAEVKALEDKPHVIKISAVFDTADIGRARRAFQLLDNAISYDAMQRLRSSPQGSVLGALNALFSPHPVIGGPSPQQAAAKGLLGQMFAAQGGGSAVVPGGQRNGPTVLDVLAGRGTPTAAAAGAAAGTGTAAGDLQGAAMDEKQAAAASKAAAADQAAAAAGLRDAAGELRDAAIGMAGAKSAFSALDNLFRHSDQVIAGQLAAAAAGGAAGGAGTGGTGGGGAAAAAGAGGILGGRGAAGIAAGAGWGTLIGHISLAHVALDGVLESLIAVGSATAALTVGLTAMSPAARNIYTQMKSVATVDQALGVTIPPLTGSFQALAKSLAPNTIEAFGGGLNLVSANSGVLASVAHQVATGIDDVVARLDLWNASQKRTGKLLQDGVGFLHQFTGIAGSLGLALGNLVRADPGTAHFLLDVVGAGAKLLDWATKIPTPLLAAGLGLHSVYVWGNVASGALGRLVGLVPGLSKVSDLLKKGFSFSTLANPMVGGALLAAAAVYEVVVNWDKASKAAQGYVAGLDSALAQMSASGSIVAISADIGDLNQKIQGAFSPAALAQINAGWSSLSNTGRSFSADLKADAHDWAKFWDSLATSNYLTVTKNFGNAVKGIFVPGQGVAQVAASNVALYKGEIDKLLGSQKNLLTETGTLVKGGYSLSQSFAIIDLAGVQAGDSLDLMGRKVKNLITGYDNLSAGGPLLAGNVDAVTFAALQQQSKVSALNAGWDAFLTTVTGGESAITAFGQDLAALTTANHAAGAGIAGLGAAALAQRQAFLTAAGAANTQMDSLTTLASAAALGSTGTGLLVSANKDLVAALLPSARGSQAMTTILYALAQRGGYTGADSFKALATWVGNVKEPMKSLDQITTTLTTDAGNLATDVQNLSTALGVTLNNAIAQVMLAETGGLKPMEDLYNAIKATGLNSRTTKDDALKLADQFYLLSSKSVPAAKSEFETFATQSLGLTQKQADTLWKTTLPGLQGQINQMHGKNIPMTMTVSGSGSITTKASGIVSSIEKFLVFARGGMIPVTGGVPGVDSVPIMAMPGELVVPTAMVSAGLVDNLRGMIPGFAAGGLVSPAGIGSRLGGAENWLAGTMGADERSAAVSMERSTLSTEMTSVTAAVTKAIAAAVAAAAAALGSFLGGAASPGTSAAAAQAYARSVLPGGWSWPDLLALWNRESGWRWDALNPSSGAYGIPQSLPAGKMAAAGSDWRTNPATQIRWGLGYIAGRYGDSQNAWAHETSFGWYDDGGWLQPGWTFAYNGTGRPEPVMPARAGSAMAPGGPGVSIRDINIYKDPGETTAHVLQELAWQMRVAQMQQWSPHG